MKRAKAIVVSDAFRLSNIIDLILQNVILVFH